MRPRRARTGDGTAWLVVDQLNGEYLCYWYAGPGGGELMEYARVANDSDAVAWGRLRTSRRPDPHPRQLHLLGRDRTQTAGFRPHLGRPRHRQPAESGAGPGERQAIADPSQAIDGEVDAPA